MFRKNMSGVWEEGEGFEKHLSRVKELNKNPSRAKAIWWSARVE